MKIDNEEDLVLFEKAVTNYYIDLGDVEKETISRVVGVRKLKIC